MKVKQFGLTNGCSTSKAGVEFIQQIFEAWEELRDPIGVFFDLIKALIWKLRRYGARGRSFGLLESCSSGKVQSVRTNGERSSESAFNLDVPQSSALGSFSFLVYINDLHTLIRMSTDRTVC
ncbi:hypothetical protein EVAR_45423_1 [Eumeta japonica]|uniref:Reverse transcriptase domain-containing protein n=1 Tax=Eumeta variegata TaxID=151549 RepID=A0A4C1ZGY4_EUMVA|nr:hypothetical protein EVAR_45423_1 [Eumeta japonica]